MRKYMHSFAFILPLKLLLLYTVLFSWYGTNLSVTTTVSKKMWVYRNEKSTYFVSWSKLMILHNLVLCRDRILQRIKFCCKKTVRTLNFTAAWFFLVANNYCNYDILALLLQFTVQVLLKYLNRTKFNIYPASCLFFAV